MASRIATIAGAVLAAGSSSRMGQNKLYLEWQGETLLQRAVRVAVLAGLDPVIVVAGFEFERVTEHLAGQPCRIIENTRYETGMHSSAATAARAVSDEAAALVMLLPDMPLVAASMLKQLQAEYLAGSARLVASRYGDVVAPPTLFGASLFPQLRSLEDGAVRRVVEELWDEVTVLDWPPSLLRDLDTPADLEALRAAVNTGHAS
jgi:molybdenum cofactor cytidylyltransferase